MRGVSRSGGLDLSPLEVLGFSAQTEGIYRLVLRNSGSSLPALASLAALRIGELREHVSRLATEGLVELRDDHVVAHPPEEALARLVNAEQRKVRSRSDQLDAVRGLLPSLSVDHLASTTPAGRPVAIEVVEGGDVAQLIRTLSAASSGDLLWLRPDPWRVARGREIDDWVIEMLQLGRRSRAVYGVEVLRRAPDLIRRRAEAGEQVRVLPRVPTRMAVLGGSAALLGERFDVSDQRRLVLRHQSVVAALSLMFEGLWDRATAVPGLSGRGDDQDTAGAQRMLLEQLAGGAKDEQIARALGTSVRTVRRRVADLLEQLGADSRFQAGAEAVRRGWL